MVLSAHSGLFRKNKKLQSCGETIGVFYDKYKTLERIKGAVDGIKYSW